MSPDSLEYLEPEDLGGLNLYSYCNNNPVNYYDPSGHFIALLIASIVGFAVLGGVAAGLTAYENRASGWSMFGSALLGTLFGGAIGALAGLAMGFIGPAIGGLDAMMFGDVMAMSGAMALVGVLAQLGVAAGAIYVTAAGATALGNIVFSRNPNNNIPMNGTPGSTVVQGGSTGIYDQDGHLIYRHDVGHSHYIKEFNGSYDPHTHQFIWKRIKGVWRYIKRTLPF